MKRSKLTVLAALIFILTGVSAAFAAGPESLTKTFDAFTDAPENHLPSETYREYDTDYVLDDYTVVDDKLTGRTMPASDVISYESVPEGMAPETATIVVTDPDTGEDVNVTAALTDAEYTNEHWSDDFSFTVTVHDYDANAYRLGDKIVKLDPVSPLKGYEADLLTLIGVGSRNYRIDNIYWISEPYTGADGRLCRDLEAAGGMRVFDCNATYETEAKLPDLDAKRIIATYRRIPVETEPAETEASVTEAPETEPETTAPMPIMEKAPEKKGFLGFITAVFEAIRDFVRENPVVTSVALIIILLALAAFLVFPRWKKTKARCRYDESVQCPYKKQEAAACRNCEYFRQNMK